MPTRSLAVALVALPSLAACSDATGSVSGGQALLVSAEGGGAPTWSALYGDFFGPSGQASCTAQSSCHGDSSMSGAQISGFVCGSSKEACWQGMTQGIPADAGGVFPPIVTPGATDPTTTVFFKSLHLASSSTENTLCSKNVVYTCNMPCGDSPNCHTNSATYTFTSDDLARITTWIQQGAQDN